MAEFYDAVTPSNIPNGSYAVLYADGLYKATSEQASRFRGVLWNTVYGGKAAASYSACIDYEQGNPSFEGNALYEWAAERKAMNAHGRVYCDLSNYPRAKAAVAGLGNIVWWLATLDGNKLNPYYVPDLWAVQYQGGMDAEYDVSWLYGPWIYPPLKP